tara:strand:+ start:808 stop:1308 length:501 start_codon:yes stop_codon:yes gene_type:complete
MVSFQSAILAALSWSITPIVVMDNDWPIRCGIHYYDDNKNISLKLEKFVRETRVLTSMTVEVPGQSISSVSLKTRTINTKTIFQNPINEKETFYTEKNLEQSDQGGLLMFEIANFGGELIYKTNETQVKLNLPSRLSRNVTGAYLNCAGDLIRPDNEISFYESTAK